MSYGVTELQPGIALVRASGSLTANEATQLYDELLSMSGSRSIQAVQIDLRGVEILDSPAAAAVCVAVQELQRAGKRTELVHGDARQQRTFELIRPPSLPAPRETPGHWLERVGDFGLRAARGLVQLAEFSVDTAASAGRALVGRERVRLGTAVEQAVHLGVRAVPIVALLTFLTGLILAFQAAYQLERFGAAIFMAEIVSLSMVREFASLMTALILAGRNSSAIAAELGTMAVREEIDALRTTGIDPVSFLVLPRLFAMTLVQPALTALAALLGIAGGLLVAWITGLPVLGVYHRMRETLTPHDFALGAVKSVLFAWIVGFTGCYLGFETRGGPSSVGRNTTRAVVTAIFLIVVVDSVVTTLWTLAGYGER